MSIDAIIENALIEDIQDGDHSALSCIPKSAVGKAQLLIKANGILAGMEVAQKVFAKVDSTLVVHPKLTDGTPVEFGAIAFTVEGSSQSLLMAERLALNIMQRMSGIATRTNEYVQKVQHTKAKILDTRKTTPNLRILEKMAVKIGGGENHRFGLYDMIMLKDNHIDFAGGVEQAITKAKNYLAEKQLSIPIEVETRNLQEVEQVLKTGGIQRIMLDNFDYTTTRKAVELINGAYEIESSGGINLDTVVGYAECGVDFISVGELTHTVKAFDMSLKAID